MSRGGPRFLTQEQADRLLVEDAMRTRRERPSLLERLDTLRQEAAAQPLNDAGLRFLAFAEEHYPRVHAEQQAAAAARRPERKPRGPKAGEEWAELLEAGTVVRVRVADRAEENRVRSRLINVGKRHGFRVRTAKEGDEVAGERVA